MYIYICICIYTHICNIVRYVCMYVCMCIYIYIYTYVFTHARARTGARFAPPPPAVQTASRPRAHVLMVKHCLLLCIRLSCFKL